MIYRQSWFKLDGYDIAEKFLKGTPSEDWEYRFIWYGGEFECNFGVADGWDVSVSIVPAGSKLINMNAGFRYQFESNRGSIGVRKVK